MRLIFITLLFCMPVVSFAQNDHDFDEKRIISNVDSTHADNMVLEQHFVVNVALDSVWNAFTTKRGWESWAVAKAEVDLKIKGTIKTNYNKTGVIGDESTITLNILNYVPNSLLTLQAELTKNFPEFMREDEKDMYNIILFEEINPKQTKVTSYGIGYKNDEKYKSMMKFFIQGNEQSYLNLIAYLETGKPTTK